MGVDLGVGGHQGKVVVVMADKGAGPEKEGGLVVVVGHDHEEEVPVGVVDLVEVIPEGVGSVAEMVRDHCEEEGLEEGALVASLVVALAGFGLRMSRPMFGAPHSS